MSTKPSPRPAVRSARPVVSVKHRFLAWDKPQFLVENSSPDTGPRPTPMESKNSKARNVKLTVTRSADCNSVLRGRGAITEEKFGNSLLKRNSSHSKPVIINDLWKPLSATNPVQVKTAGDNDYVSRSLLSTDLSRPMSGFEKFNARTEAQALLRNPRSSLHQFLRSPASRTTERLDSGSPHHPGNHLGNRIRQVAGYQIYGRNAPKSTVYNLNEHIVSDTDISSLSFISNENKDTMESVSSPDLISCTKSEGRSLTRKDDFVDNKNSDVSTTLNTKSNRQPTSKKVSFQKRNKRKSVDKTAVDVPSSEDEVDTYTPIRVSVRVSSSTCRSDGELSSPTSMDEINAVGRENSIDDTSNDCSMCPMCRAQAAVKEAVSIRLEHSEQLGKDTMKKTDDNTVDMLTKTEGTNIKYDNMPVNKLDFKGEIMQSQRESGTASLSETSSSTSTNKPTIIDSYSVKVELLGDKNVSPRTKHFDKYHHAGVDILKSPFESNPQSHNQKFNPYWNKDTVPKKRSPAMVVNGNGLALSNELERYRPSPLHSRKWYVDAARPMPHPSPRNVTPAPQIPLHMPAEALSMENHRVPLVIWKKMQQRESLVQPHYGNARARLGGHNGGMTVSSVGQSQMVVHIPTGEFQPEEMDCPPNTPTPE